MLHSGAIAGDQLAVRGGVHESGAGGLFPGEVRGLGHELVRPHQRQFGQTAEIGFIPPDSLLGIEHRVVVAVRRSQVGGQAVRDHLVAWPPAVHSGAGPQDDTGKVGADHVVGQIMPLSLVSRATVALEERERRNRLEDGAPYGVVVHRTRHDGDQNLARPGFGSRNFREVYRLGRVFVRGGEPFEHVDLVGEQDRATIRVGNLHGREVLGGSGVRDRLH